MSTDRDDAPARRYRQASATLDERPSAATRAAILAAAARQVEARPRSADAPRVVRRTRWPLAAAAAVLLSTLAVMMANRTGQEMPTFTVPAERAPEAIAVAPAPPVAATATRSPDSAAPLPAPPMAAAPAPVAKRSTNSNAREERSSVPAMTAERMEAQRSDVASPAVAARSTERAPEVASAQARQDLPAAPPAASPAPPPAAPLARSTPAPAAAGALPAPEVAAEKPAAATTDRASAQERAPAAQGAARLEAARDFEGSAPKWLERIAKLRREGRDAEADAELKRFRERYPDVQVSPAALPGGAAVTR
jgi:hypothetical protein